MIIQPSFGAIPQVDRSQVSLVDNPLDDLIMTAWPGLLAEADASPSYPAGTEPAELSPARPPRRLSDEEDEEDEGSSAGDDDDGEDEEDEESEDGDEEEDEEDEESEDGGEEEEEEEKS